MKRSIRLCLFTVFFGLLAFSSAIAQPKIPLSGSIGPDSVRVLLKDNTYYLNNHLLIKGTLIIEPGTRIEFYDNSRIVVGTGGRLLADGFATLKEKGRPNFIGSPANITNYFPENGYADMNCFLFPIGESNTNQYRDFITAGLFGADELNVRERTIHPSKYNHIFNVAIDIKTRRLVNITNPNDPN